jgi:hypothetical protein
MKRLIVAAALGLGACTAQTATLADDRGHVQICTNSDYGIGGVILAHEAQAGCIASLEQAGFHIVSQTGD